MIVSSDYVVNSALSLTVTPVIRQTFGRIGTNMLLCFGTVFILYFTVKDAQSNQSGYMGEEDNFSSNGSWSSCFVLRCGNETGARFIMPALSPMPSASFETLHCRHASVPVTLPTVRIYGRGSSSVRIMKPAFFK